MILPNFFSRCSAFLTIGDNNEAYYRHYGVPDTKMIRGSFPVDVSRFALALHMGKSEREKKRATLHLKVDAFVGLFVGKFIEIKRPFDVVYAVHQLRNQLPEFQVLMLGSGPLEREIKQEIDRLGLQDRVMLTGFINQQQIPEVLCLGDVLIMSSEVDPHPLAVTEAMSVGNAVIASSKVGCVGPSDAARIGENALVYPCGDITALCERILYLAKNQDELARYQARSIALAQTQDVEAMTDAVLRALAPRVAGS